mmetsp:Transcript_29073/g.52979  ORF Transcript_29073/g.52979 Transcript_29073/m.52979 type:complete len:131 (-) Transcript_29073:177-569(-)
MALNAARAGSGPSSSTNTEEARAYQVHAPSNRYEEKPRSRSAGNSYIDDRGRLCRGGPSSEALEEDGGRTSWWECITGWFGARRAYSVADGSEENVNTLPETVESQVNVVKGENPDNDAMRERRLRRFAQ